MSRNESGRSPALAPKRSAAGGEPGNYVRRKISRQASALPGTRRGRRRAAPPPGRRPAGATTTRATRAIPRGTGPGRRDGVAPLRSFTIRWLVHTSNVWSWQLESPQNVDPLRKGIVTGGGPERRETPGPPEGTARPTGHAAMAWKQAGPRRRIGVVKFLKRTGWMPRRHAHGGRGRPR